jgi:preprotein translocase subunit SecB
MNMTEEQNQDQAIPQADGGAGQQIQLQKIYAKDVSFETPNAPEVFKDQGQADVKLNLAQRVEELGNDLEEIVLTVTVTAMIGEKTAYLAEVAQAGIFMIGGFNEQQKHAIVNTFCPNTLFPYARTAISNLVADGGFPPLTLQPVSFEQLYAQRMQQMAAEQAQAGDAGSEETVAAEFKTDD